MPGELAGAGGAPGGCTVTELCLLHPPFCGGMRLAAGWVPPTPCSLLFPDATSPASSCRRRHGDWLPTVFLPLREVSSRELALVCAHQQLPLADPVSNVAGGSIAAVAVDKKNINSLAAAFIAGMETHNPGGW